MLLSEGYNVVAFSSTKGRYDKCVDELKDFDSEHYIVLQGDVTEKESMKSVVDTTLEKFGQIDILINNAGVLYFDEIDKVDMERFRQMMDINVHGLILLTQLVVPYMKKRDSGLIINFSSIAGLKTVATGEFYSASKFAVKGFSDGLRQELSPSGIKVSTIYPGMVKTDLFDKEELEKRKEKYGGELPSMLDVSDIARAISMICSQSEISDIYDITIMPFRH